MELEMKSKKIRRHSGRKTPRISKSDVKYSYLIDEAMEPSEKYNDWCDYRDGRRDFNYLNWKKRDKKKQRSII